MDFRVDDDTLGIPAAVVAGLVFDLLASRGVSLFVTTAVPPLVMAIGLAEKAAIANLQRGSTDQTMTASTTQ